MDTTFRLPNSQSAAVISGGGFFSWGTKFRYTGRTEREILTENINALREQKINNSNSSKRKASSVPATPSSPQGDLAQIRKIFLIDTYTSKSLAIQIPPKEFAVLQIMKTASYCYVLYSCWYQISSYFFIRPVTNAS